MAGRDYRGEKGEVVVLGSQLVSSANQEFTQKEIKEAQERVKDKVKIFRRPEWDIESTPEMLEAKETFNFLEWHRDLSKIKVIN